MTKKQRNLETTDPSELHAPAAFKLKSLEFANPLTVPMERRKQTFAVIFYIFMFLFMPGLCIYIPLWIFFNTQYWWLV
jgi:hypothetical protein